MNEEPFGPVAILNALPDDAAMIAEANRLPYGLAAYAFTQNAKRVNLDTLTPAEVATWQAGDRLLLNGRGLHVGVQFPVNVCQFRLEFRYCCIQMI